MGSKHNDKIDNLEFEMSKFEESLSIAIGICVLLATVCNLLMLYICCWASTNRNKPTETVKEKDATKTKSVKDSEVQTEPAAISPAVIAKKVSFSDDNNNDNDKDISMKLNVRRIIRKDPNRRVTWCPGTFKKLALEAQQLIREI